jgi:hypothetical protein
MRQIKQILVTAALSALVIIAGISASQANSKHVVKAKHKHSVKRGKHHSAYSQTLVKPEAENEHGAVAPQDSLWFLNIPDDLRASWDKTDQENMSKMDHDGILGGTGSPLDTVAILGPFNQGGLTTGLLVSSANGNYFACAPKGGGLWKSTNNGQLWLPVDTPAIQTAGGICENPFNHNILYVAAVSGVVYKSTDAGNTFTATSAAGYVALACDRVDASTVYDGANGLQRSTDNGSTWHTVSGFTGVVTSIIPLPSGRVLITKDNSGIYTAINGKTGSFTQVTSSAFPTTVTYVKIANSPSSPNVVYAAFYNNTGTTNFCVSVDSGLTWTAKTAPSVGVNQWAYPIALGVSNTDPNKVVCGVVTAQYTTDGGTTWSTAQIQIHADFHSYANFPSPSNKFIFGTDGGVGTQNFGRNIGGWDTIHYIQFDTVLNNNYVTTLMNSVGFASSTRKCIAGGQDIHTFRINPPSDALGLWTGGDAGYNYISQQDTNLGYWTITGNNLYKETNLFTTTPSNTNITPAVGSQGTNFYNFYRMNYGDGTQLYYRTANGIWRTTNSGSTWAQLNSASISGINFIGCTNAANPSIYFDGYDGTNRHFYRIDNAASLTPPVTPVDLSAGLGDNFDPMGEISVDATTQSTLYIGFEGTSITHHHAWKVLNANTATPTWVDISGTTTPLPAGLGVVQIQADPSDATTLLAATLSGVYFSTNSGADWIKETRLPTKAIYTQMELRASDRKLFLSVWGRGVWYGSLKSLGGGIVQRASVDPTPATPQLQFSLYPNPATEKLTVSSQQTLSSSARIAIYSSDGRMISESAWNPTGEVNIGSLPSGAYFLQITDGNLVAKNKFIKQ